jgi:hypothetical protein
MSKRIEIDITSEKKRGGERGAEPQTSQNTGIEIHSEKKNKEGH